MSWEDSQHKFLDYIEELYNTKVLSKEQYLSICNLYQESICDLERYLASDARWF